MPYLTAIACPSSTKSNGSTAIFTSTHSLCSSQRTLTSVTSYLFYFIDYRRISSAISGSTPSSIWRNTDFLALDTILRITLVIGSQSRGFACG
ncbi:hypothetical protein [Methanosarcina sp. UBA289]|uniref:hypothetical protein n=1 Tax=Methanosarcina sp. UBA289 TaxID=1915574 RepID=UPI0025CBEE1B|nr:hypothetical protein [Methanosarcina sp. UBA289]